MLTRVAGLSVQWIRRQEGIVLFTAFLVVVALYGFAELSAEMLEGDSKAFDEWVLRSLRDPGDPARPIGPPWVREAALELTVLGGRTVLVIVLLLTLGYLALDHKYGAMAFIVAAATGGGVLSLGMKELFARQRPDIVPHLVSAVSPSFPSGHSMVAVVIYLALGALLARFAARRRLRVYCVGAALLLSFLVGVTRMYVGVHYPTDVLAGWAAGLAWALVCWLVARYFQYRGRVTPRS
jgi:undecaprenyl-diphosphatase